MNPFEWIPRDCTVLIISFLDHESVGTARLVCRDWANIIRTVPALYQLIMKRLWDIQIPLTKQYDWIQAYHHLVRHDIKLVETAEDWPHIEKAASALVQQGLLLNADYVYYKGIFKFSNKCSPLLGNYANFHWNYTKLYSVAEKFYRLAITADPHNVWPLCNFGTFLWDVRGNLHLAAEYYEKALLCDGTHLDTLLNYADFMHEIKNNVNRAEELYQCGLQHHPTNAKLLGHYALFLLNKKRDPKAAGELYKKAADAHTDNAEALGNYAWFLSSDYARNYEQAEQYYNRAISVNPNYVHALYNYAMFLQDDKKDLASAKQMYERALCLQGSNVRILQSYSALLAQMHKLDEADVYYKLAISKDPDNVDLLRSFAHYLSAYRGQHAQAEHFNLKALTICRDDPYILLNYASCILLQENKQEQGMKALQVALSTKSVVDVPFISTVGWLLYFIHSIHPQDVMLSLSHVKQALTIQGKYFYFGFHLNIFSRHSITYWMQL